VSAAISPTNLPAPRSTRLWARWTVAWLVVWVVATFFMADARSTELRILGDIARGVPQVEGEVADSDTRIRLLTSITIVAGIAAMIGWVAWQLRAQANLRALGAKGLRFPPVLAVASWFVPVVNLVVPGLAVRELWKGSEPGTKESDWRSQRLDPRVWAWWAAGLATAVLAFFTVRAGVASHASWFGVLSVSPLSLRAAVHANPAVPHLLTRDRFMIWASVFGVIGGVLAITVLLGVEWRQDIKSDAVAPASWARRSDG